MTAFGPKACRPATTNLICTFRAGVTTSAFKQESADGNKLFSRLLTDLPRRGRRPTDAYSYREWLELKLTQMCGMPRSVGDTSHEPKSRRDGADGSSNLLYLA